MTGEGRWALRMAFAVVIHNNAIYSNCTIEEVQFPFYLKNGPGPTTLRSSVIFKFYDTWVEIFNKYALEPRICISNSTNTFYLTIASRKKNEI